MTHTNSLLAEPKISVKQEAYLRIESVLLRNGPMTAREILRALYGECENDTNLVRPRVSELVNKLKRLKECGKKTDFKTGKQVMMVRIKRPEENLQQELF